MAKNKMTVSIDPDVLAEADAAARAEGLNRSAYVERTLRREHYRRLLATAEPGTSSSEHESDLRELLRWQATLGNGDTQHAS
jgi:hypothetical protein